MHVRELPRSQFARLTQIDYDRGMAFIATSKRKGGDVEILGLARAIADPDNTAAEFAIIVRSDIKGQGLGPILLKKIIDYCRRRGTKELLGKALFDNERLRGLVQRFGFEVTLSPAAWTVNFEVGLGGAGPAVRAPLTSGVETACGLSNDWRSADQEFPRACKTAHLESSPDGT
jgi:acetyltransferase